MSARLIADGLPVHYSDKDLLILFQSFGPVVSAQVAANHDSRSLRFGYVEMESADAASRAMAGLNGQAIKGCSITVHLDQRPLVPTAL
jgi:RNA recognition motif-containing protein